MHGHTYIKFGKRSFGSKGMLMLLNGTNVFPNLAALPLLLRYVQYSHLESRAVCPEFLWCISVPVGTFWSITSY